MGSWDETCFASQLPIECGDPVRLVLLTDVRCRDESHAGGFCYPHELWSPRCVPLRGTYDDYGRVSLAADKVSRLNQRIVRDGFRLDLAEAMVKVAAEKRADNGARRSSSLAGMLNAVERGWMYIEREESKAPRLVGATMVHEGIYQAMCATERGIAMETVCNAAKWAAGLRQAPRSPSLELADLYNTFRSFDRPFQRGIAFYGEEIARRVRDGEIEPTDERIPALIAEISDLFAFTAWLSNARKFWHPQSGKGSQNTETSGQVALAHATLEHAERVAKKRATEAEDD